MISAKDASVLALHEILEQDFTEVELRIMLVAFLEQSTSNNYMDMIQLLSNFRQLFKKEG
jgi:hypothetical protein